MSQYTEGMVGYKQHLWGGSIAKKVGLSEVECPVFGTLRISTPLNLTQSACIILN